MTHVTTLKGVVRGIQTIGNEHSITITSKNDGKIHSTVAIIYVPVDQHVGDWLNLDDEIELEVMAEKREDSVEINLDEELPEEATR